MTSPTPLLYGTYYHIYNRGNNRENIFIEERNYEHFLNLYAKYIEPIADTFAYCLLRNHFHLAIRVKTEMEILPSTRETLKVSFSDRARPMQMHSSSHVDSKQRKPLGSEYASRQFSNFFNAYSKAINNAYGRTGSLFQHPFGRIRIDNGPYFWNVIAYIHQNPQKHGFVEDFRDWKYSSYGIILDDKKTFVDKNVVMNWFGGREQYSQLHSEWITGPQTRWFVEDDED